MGKPNRPSGVFFIGLRSGRECACRVVHSCECRVVHS